MFDERALSEELSTVRAEHAPAALVFDVQRDFETLPTAVAESLLAVVDDVDPSSHETAWVPDDAPETLATIASEAFTVGAPGDGSVAWTRQTTPPIVLIKPRLEGSPAGFVEFLVAEALVEIGVGVPEQFLGFFEERYRELAEAVSLSPADTYQLAAALADAHVGLQTRPIFASWETDVPELHDEWLDAGERLKPRLGELSRDVALGRTEFSEAAELACSAVKHDIELPTPFDALDTDAYRQHGAAFAVEWAERTLGALEEEP